MPTPPGFPAPSEHARHWRLDPATCYLNHGSFGACPSAVLEAQSAYRDQMEGDGVEWFVKRMYPLLDRARESLGRLVDADPADVVFVPNATTGVATALASLQLGAGDQVVAPDQEYPACLNNVRRIAARAGAEVVTPRLAWPTTGADEILRTVLDAITDRTRAVLISHVTSPTGLVLPVERLVPLLRERGIVSIVDGAHVPGFVPLSIRGLDPDFYTANCHKWVCSPKGSGMLYVRRDRQASVRPLVLSNHAESGHPRRPFFQCEFDYVGTSDITAYLAVHDAIGFMGSLVPGGYAALMERNRAVAVEARRVLCGALGVEAPAPESMLGCLAAVLAPMHEPERDARLRARPTPHADALQDVLYEKHRIQVPVWRFGAAKRRMIRVSAQAYNAIGQYEYLGRALAEELEAERRM